MLLYVRRDRTDYTSSFPQLLSSESSTKQNSLCQYRPGVRNVSVPFNPIIVTNINGSFSAKHVHIVFVHNRSVWPLHADRSIPDQFS